MEKADCYHKIWRGLKPLEKYSNSGQRKFQKLLDKGYVLWYYSQARPSESEGKSEANLENDTERNAQTLRKE